MRIERDARGVTTVTAASRTDLAFGIGYYQNTSDATVYGDATIDAGDDTTVDATLTYPFLNNPDLFSSDFPEALGDIVVTNGVSGVTTDMLDGTLGLG